MALAAVRAATPADAVEIARIQSETWATAYSALVPASAVEALRGPRAREAWAAASAAGAVLVATEGEWTVGFVAAGAATGATEPGGTGAGDGRAASGTTTSSAAASTAAVRLGPGAWGEVGVLLVEPRWGRRGHGGRLLAAAAERLRGAGARYGLAWVPETDTASLRFYARAGWEPDGAVRGLDTGEGVLREVRVTGRLDLRLTS